MSTAVVLIGTVMAKVPFCIAADNNLILFYFSKKIKLDISCESFAQQTIHIN